MCSILGLIISTHYDVYSSEEPSELANICLMLRNLRCRDYVRCSVHSVNKRWGQNSDLGILFPEICHYNKCC